MGRRRLASQQPACQAQPPRSRASAPGQRADKAVVRGHLSAPTGVRGLPLGQAIRAATTSGEPSAPTSAGFAASSWVCASAPAGWPCRTPFASSTPAWQDLSRRPHLLGLSDPGASSSPPPRIRSPEGYPTRRPRCPNPRCPQPPRTPPLIGRRYAAIPRRLSPRGPTKLATENTKLLVGLHLHRTPSWPIDGTRSPGRYSVTETCILPVIRIWPKVVL